MVEFFEKNLCILIFLICLGSFVIYLVKKDEKKRKEVEGDTMHKKTEEGQKKEK